MSRAGRVRGPSGFSFLEVMVSLFVLSVIVGEVGLITISALRTSALAQRLTRANVIVETVLETSRNAAFENLATKWCVAANPSAGCAAGDPIETFATNGTQSLFSWDYDVPNGNSLAPVFQRIRTVEYKKYVNVAGTVSETPVAVAAVATATWADVAVTVEWTDGQGRKQQIQAATRIAKY